jgi:hypothetical protein
MICWHSGSLIRPACFLTSSARFRQSIGSLWSGTHASPDARLCRTTLVFPAPGVHDAGGSNLGRDVQYGERRAIFEDGQRGRPSMRPCRLSTAVLIITAFFCYGRAATGFEGNFKLPCLIYYNKKLPVAVTCAVMVTLEKGHIIELAKTPNGKTFVIENDKSDSDKWYLDHEPAVETSGEPASCYRNSQVRVCL